MPREAPAARFGLPIETLRTVNGIGARATVPVGHALLVPSQAPSDATAATLQNTVFTAVPNARTVYHRVGNNDTLASIATRFDVTQQDLKAWNAGAATKLVPGQKLRVISDAGPAGASKQSRRKASVSRTAGHGAKPAAKPTSRPRVASGNHP